MCACRRNGIHEAFPSELIVASITRAGNIQQTKYSYDLRQNRCGGEPEREKKETIYQYFGYFSFSEDNPIVSGPRNHSCRGSFIYRHEACRYKEEVTNVAVHERHVISEDMEFVSFCWLILLQVQPLKRHSRCP